MHLKCETAAEEIFRPLAMRRLNLRIGKDVLLLIEDTLEVAKQTFAIGGVVRRRGLRLCCLGVGSQLRGPSPSTWSVSAAWAVTELSVSVSTAWN